MSWLIPEKPLRKTVETTVGDVIGGPVDTDSMREVARQLSIAVGRERTLEFLADTVHRAGVDLSPGASWALLRLGAPDAPSVENLAARPHVRRERRWPRSRSCAGSACSRASARPRPGASHASTSWPRAPTGCGR